MIYDFDTVIDRRNTYSYKWDIPEQELPMWVADMDFRTAPEIISALEQRAKHGVFGYTTIPEEWYEAYIQWWKIRHHVTFQKEQMIFSTGVIPTISSCVRKLTTPAENVVLLTPVYPVFYNCIRNNGRNVLSCPMIYEQGNYFIDWENLENQFADPQTTMMILCNPHNPFGKIWDKQTLFRIGELAVQYGVMILSDEIHCDLTDPNREYTPFLSVSENCRKNSITCISPTKAFNLAGLQTSAVVVPNAQLRHKVWRRINTDECGEPNAFAIQAAISAFRSGGAWLEELRQYLYQNKQTALTFFSEQLPEISPVFSEATYLLWLDCSALSIPAKDLSERIRKLTGVYLSDGTPFGNAEYFLRMNIACPNTLLLDGLNRLKSAITSIQSTS